MIISRLFICILLFASVPKLAFAFEANTSDSTETLNAGKVAILSQKTEITFSKVVYRTSEIELSGALGVNFPFSDHLQVFVVIDQEVAQRFTAGISLGNILFGKAETDGKVITVRLTGKPKTISAVKSAFRKPADFSDLIHNISFNFLTKYVVDVEPMASAGLDELSSECGKRLEWPMRCEEFSGLKYPTALKCLDNASIRSAFSKYVRISDPFIFDQDTRIRLRAVTQDLCGQKVSTSSILTAVAGELLLTENHQSSEPVSVLSSITLGVLINWQ